MFTLQQVIKATAAANASVGGSATDLYKFLRAATRGVTSSAEATTTNTAITQTQTHTQLQPQEPKQSSQASSEFNFSDGVSHNSPAKAHGCCRSESESKSESAHDVNPTTAAKQFVRNLLVQHSQDLQQRFIHSKCGSQDSAKSSQQQQQQTTKFAMSSLAAEPLQAEISSGDGVNTVGTAGTEGSNATAGTACHEAASSAGKKPCFNTGLADILQFMELIGNLKVSTGEH